LAKPSWRVKVGLNKKITPSDIEEAISWGKRLSIDYEPLIKLLKKKNLNSGDKAEIKKYASIYAVKMLERAGIDVVYDGEQQRSEMYQYAVNLSQGFVFRGLVRSFDNKYYQKAACVGVPYIKKPWHTQELELLKKITDKEIKIPITGAYTIAAWSFDEYYQKKLGGLGGSNSLSNIGKARRQFVMDVARNLIRPNIKALLEKGATWIQIDEPAATTIPSEVPLFVESFNESVKGLKGKFSVHICFSDYRLLFPHIKKMENCAQYALEFSNRDSKKLGTKEGDRPGYEILKWFKKYKIPSKIGLGVTDIHSDFIESSQLIRDRILYSAKILGDSSLINPTPDCGLRTRSWEVAFKKLSAIVEGSRLAEKSL
jgi:5-methyltetrahydropteroyltriglutamate--homocysteine methyltransferase